MQENIAKINYIFNSIQKYEKNRATYLWKNFGQDKKNFRHQPID